MGSSKIPVDCYNVVIPTNITFHFMYTSQMCFSCWVCKTLQLTSCRCQLEYVHEVSDTSEFALAGKISSVALRTVVDCANLGSDHGCETGTQSETCPQLKHYGATVAGAVLHLRNHSAHLSFHPWCASSGWMQLLICECYPDIICQILYQS